MRYLMVLFLMGLFAASCKKDKGFTPAIPLNEMAGTSAALTYSGNFMSGPYGTVSGRAEIYKDSAGIQIKLAAFNSTNGPDLHVYISKEAMPGNFIDLGRLKSVTGNQVYAVTGTPDFASYKYISIHCVAFNHLFGSALLQ